MIKIECRTCRANGVPPLQDRSLASYLVAIPENVLVPRCQCQDGITGHGYLETALQELARYARAGGRLDIELRFDPDDFDPDEFNTQEVETGE